MRLTDSKISACARKIGYTSLRMAQEELRKAGEAYKLRYPYKCDACGCWHTTLNYSVRLKTKYLSRLEEELFPAASDDSLD